MVLVDTRLFCQGFGAEKRKSSFWPSLVGQNSLELQLAKCCPESCCAMALALLHQY